MNRIAVAVALVLALAPLPARAGAKRESMIVSAAWLASHLKDPNLVLLHVGPREGYDASHIAGARYVKPGDLSLPRVEGSLILEMPPAATLEAALEGLGISNGSRIVITFADEWLSPAARIFFTLDYAGLGDRTSILDGGVRSWLAAGQPVTAELPVVKPGRLTVRVRRDLIVDAAWVQAHAKDPRTAVIDARDREYYDGVQTGDRMRRGHIPGAASLPFGTLVTEPALTFADSAAMRKLLVDAGAATGDTVVSYCHIGQQASVVYFAARCLGYRARIYDGSFQDWSLRDLPVETRNPER